MWRKNLNAAEVAELIQRFLEDKGGYPQEWNDFIETRQGDSAIEKIRKQCYELDPLVNCPGEQDPKAVLELQGIIAKLRTGAD